jgi:hypothetical protein
MGDSIIESVANDVAQRHPSLVRWIEVSPYEDSLGRAGVRFTVHLRDKHDQGDYSWAELSPIERQLGDGVQAIDATRIPYTDYIAEWEEALRRAEVA